MTRRQTAYVRGLLLAMLLLYWTASLSNLAVAPLVYEDEPWQASTALGARLFNAPVGLLASALLLLTRFTALSHYQMTGILWLDFTRIARYDAVVPVFGLASLHAYLTASSRSWLGWYLRCE